jgi:H+/Cl- antiporter ClcA
MRPAVSIYRQAIAWFANLRRTGNLKSRVAAIIGAMLLALVAIIFAQCGEWAQHLFIAMYRRAFWSPLIVTPALFMAVVWCTRRYWPLARLRHSAGDGGLSQARWAKAKALLSPTTALPNSSVRS